MQRVIVYLISLLMTLGSFVARAAGDGKVEQLLAQARAALGGEKNLNKVQGLTATGTYQRTMTDRQLSGDVTIDLQLPDRILRTESMNPIGDMTVITEQGLNGETLCNQRSRTRRRVRRGAPRCTPNTGNDPQHARRAGAYGGRVSSVPASMPLRVLYVARRRPGQQGETRDAKGQQLRDGCFSTRRRTPACRTGRRACDHDAAGPPPRRGTAPDLPAPQPVDTALPRRLNVTA